MAEEVASSAAAAVRSGKTAKELENTVLLGRGKSHLNHPGNRYFQDLVTAVVDAYAKEPSVFVKRQMTLKIVEQIEEKGGFLRWSSQKGDWETVDDLEERRQKVAHALQYRIRQMNNTNGGKRARMKAEMGSTKKAKQATATVISAANTTVATSTTASSSASAISTPQQVAALVKAVVPAEVVSAAVHDASKNSKPKGMIQLTEDEKLFVRNFVHNKEEDDDESAKMGSAVGTSAVSLAARAASSEAATTKGDRTGSVPPAIPIAEDRKAINKFAAEAANAAVAVVEAMPSGPTSGGLVTTKVATEASLVPASEPAESSALGIPKSADKSVSELGETKGGTEAPNITSLSTTSDVPSPLDATTGTETQSEVVL